GSILFLAEIEQEGSIEVEISIVTGIIRPSLYKGIPLVHIINHVICFDNGWIIGIQSQCLQSVQHLAILVKCVYFSIDGLDLAKSQFSAAVGIVPMLQLVIIILLVKVLSRDGVEPAAQTVAIILIVEELVYRSRSHCRAGYRIRCQRPLIV